MRPLALGLFLLAGLAAVFRSQTPPRSDISRVPRAQTPHLVDRPSPRYDWLQFNFDSQKTGNNAAESTVSRGNVASLARLFAVSLPEVADGAPVVGAGVATSRGPRDLAFVTTKAGRLVALDARSGALLWSVQPAAGPRYTTSSPAIDPARAFVYSYGLEGRVHKYAIASGIEIVGGGWPQLATLKPEVEKSASALAIAHTPGGHTFLYATSGGYPGDQGDYQGHVTAIDLATGSQKVFNANCSHMPLHFVESGSPDNDCAHVQSAIWARAGVVYDRTSDRIFMATGNGDFDANVGGHEWGDSVLALSPDGSGINGGPLDSYTPTNFQSLANGDVDLGSGAPAILPGPPGSRYRALAVQAGKDGLLRLLALDNLSGQGGPGHVAGELQILAVPQGGGVLTALAVWTNPTDGFIWIFVATGSGISGLELLVDGAGNPTLAPRWLVPRGGFSPIVANGVLYYAGNNQILALDPATGALLWNDTQIGRIHWQSPILVNGILYITDESGMLTAYSLGGQLPP